MLEDRFFFSLSVSIVALLVGCAGSPPPVKPAATETASKSPAAAPAPEASAGAEEPDAEEGEAAADAPSFATLRAAAMACPTDEEGALESGCEAYEQWRADAVAVEGGKANAELLRRLASKDAKERFLAADMLRGTLDDSNLEGKMADAVLDAAEKERDANVVKPLAVLAGGLNLVQVGKLDRAIAIPKAHPNPSYVEDFLFSAGSSNRDAKLVAYAVEVSKNQSSALRNAALSFLYDVASDFPAEACKTLDALRADKVAFNANRATYRLASNAKCIRYADKVLDVLSAVDVKKSVDQDLGLALNQLCGMKELSPAQRARGNKAARRISEAPAVHVNTRFYTLSAVMRCDPENGAAFVSKYKNDTEKIIADRAVELTK